MKQNVIDQARAEWREAVSELASRPYYKDQDKADNFFYTVVVPIWRSALHLGDMTPTDVMRALDVTPTMRLMLHFYGAAVLGHGLRGAPRLRHDVWPPLVTKDGLHFVHAVPKRDIGAIIGRNESAVDRAIDGFRGKRGKTGTVLYDARLAFPAPQATGIMLDGAFEMQLSLPFAYRVYDYDRLRIFAGDQRREVGVTWTMAIDWAGSANEAIHGVPSLRAVREALKRDTEKRSTGTEGR